MGCGCTPVDLSQGRARVVGDVCSATLFRRRPTAHRGEMAVEFSAFQFAKNNFELIQFES